MKMRKIAIYIKIFTIILLTYICQYPNETLLGKYLCNIRYDVNILFIRIERLLENTQENTFKQEKVKNDLECETNNKKRKNETEVTSKFTKIKNSGINDLISKTPKNKSVKKKDDLFEQKIFDYLEKLDKIQKNGSRSSNTLINALHTMYDLYFLRGFINLTAALFIPILYIALAGLGLIGNGAPFAIFCLIATYVTSFIQLTIFLSVFIPVYVKASKYYRLNK